MWTSDVLLACLFPLFVLFLGFRIFPSPDWGELRDLVFPRRQRRGNDLYSLPRATNAYARYAQLSASEVGRLRASYSTLGRVHKRLGYSIGYTKKLDRLDEVIKVNTVVTKGIADLAKREFGDLPETLAVRDGDLGRVREALKHCVRDWSEQGREERGRIFAPILRVLLQVEEQERGHTKVLVPGSGLGRLAWDISELGKGQYIPSTSLINDLPIGFDTTANELSSYMNLALRFLASPSTTISPHQHIIHPYAHWFSHQRSNASLFRGISIPDALPRLSPHFHLIEDDFLSLKAPPYSDQVRGYDYIVTLFFLDTSLNAFATMEHIHNLLRPGGTWINLGPLLWTGGAQAKVELSLEEVLQAADQIGFIIETGNDEEDARKMRTVECEYTRDEKAMMKWVYRAEFWVARRSK